MSGDVAAPWSKGFQVVVGTRVFGHGGYTGGGGEGGKGGGGSDGGGGQVGDWGRDSTLM